MGSPTVVHDSRQKERERVRGGGERGRRVIALGATVEFSRSRTARVPWQGYVLARIRERASESTRFCFVNVNERGVHNYRGNGGANPVYRSQSKHAGTILRFRSSRFVSGRIRSDAETGPGRFATYYRTLRRESHPSPPFRRSRQIKTEDRSLEHARNSRGPPNNERRRSLLSRPA